MFHLHSSYPMRNAGIWKDPGELLELLGMVSTKRTPTILSFGVASNEVYRRDDWYD